MIFEKRTNFKPFEYPELMDYVDSINHSYWVHTEWNFISDIQDFKTRISPKQAATLEKALLSIAQVEVAVKSFWGNIGNKLPKPEVAAVGATFAESEVRHERAYSHLLEVLGLNDKFSTLLENEAIRNRVEVLSQVHANANKDEEHFLRSLILFSLLIENASLFSQFLVIKSFNKYKNVLKDIDNVVQATQKEEQIHALFGIHLSKIILSEMPELLTEESKHYIYNTCINIYEAEKKIIDWMIEDDESFFFTRRHMHLFVQDRINQGITQLGLDPVFIFEHEDRTLLADLGWFNDEIHGYTHVDFFYKKSTNYSKKVKSIQADDLF